jgi:hypothetical protein
MTLEGAAPALMAWFIFHQLSHIALTSAKIETKPG